MIVCDSRPFVFVHIPKCAGTAVRRALEVFDETGGRFFARVAEHPGFGRLDYTHVPARLLARLFPEDAEKLGCYPSFAVVRDPFARFPSAMAQRIKMVHGGQISALDDRALHAELDAVIAYLSGRDDVTDPDFIHFARQVDYVELDGRRVVGTVVPIERLDRLAEAISAIVGEPVGPFAHANQTMTFARPQMRRALLTGSALAKRLLPRQLADGLRARARRAWLRPAENGVHPVFSSRTVQDFVSGYYAADVALRERAKAEAELAA